MVRKVNKHNRINFKIRQHINDGLGILNGVRDDLPFDSINKLFHSFGLKLVQEDGTDFEAFLTGTEGQIKIPVAEVNIDNTVGNFLVANWFRYATGRFDLNCYLS